MVLNETTQKLTYEGVTAITQDPLMYLVFLTIWGFPLLIYILVGIFRNARTSDGRTIKGTRMIQTINFWMVFFIWFIIQSALFIILLIYPIWGRLI